MKYTIHYEYKAVYGDPYPYWASCGNALACGDSFNDARKRLIEKLKALQIEPPEIPPDEEIEL